MTKFNGEYIWKAYQYAATGVSDRELAKMLDIMRPTFRVWRKKHKAFRHALRAGKKYAADGAAGRTLEAYIYEHLSPEVKKLWDEITRFEIMPDGPERIAELLEGEGKKTRQRLFLHAATANHFSLSKALKTVQVSKAVFDIWQAKDADFSDLVEEMEWHKKNFFEAAAIQLVGEGNAAAVIAINRAKNANRGYGEKTELELSGGIDVKQLVDIESLDLDIETRKIILAAIRKSRQDITV